MKKYLHSSLDFLPVGTVLKPRLDYVEHWGETTFYNTLEKYRPNDMLPHHDSVFMCDSIEDLDNCMEGWYLFEIVPHERVEKHDMNWSSQISMMLSDNAEEEEVAKVAFNYWHGVPSSDPLWEYQTPSAIIKEVYDYMNYEE
jgi:hypothetical protein